MNELKVKHLFDKQGDKGKTPALEQSTDAREEEVTSEAIFMFVDPIQATKKLKMKANKKLNSLVLIEPQIDEVKGEIKTLLQQVHWYGARSI